MAPLHLERVLSKGKPIAYALDGYPIYGLTEPDGSPIGKLDECHGHETPSLGYHYHAATRRPYLQSAFLGEVIEREGQVDPQPRAQSVRQDRPPLRGAKITGFKAFPDEKTFALQYTVNDKPAAVNYTNLGDGHGIFRQDFHGDDIVRQEVDGIDRDELAVDKEHEPIVGVDVDFDRVDEGGFDEIRIRS